MRKNGMIYIRADANGKIGMGHIMRCLSIADAAAALGHEVRFVLADACVEALVRERGYQAIVLQSDYTLMEDEKWPEIKAGMIIADSYYVTAKYLRLLKEKTDLLVYIDDLAAFPYPVDVLVNYNVYGSYLDYPRLYGSAGIANPRFILGPSFAPLRKMFRGVPKKEPKETVSDVLISTGGSDPGHFALKLAQANLQNRTYHILLGGMNPDKEEIKRISRKNQHIVCHENVLDMKSLICSMDIAVSAAGSTLYEICACGIPLITYILADNQIPGAEAFEKLGLAVNLGDLRGKEQPGEIILAAVEKLANDFQCRASVCSKMQSVIDGFGADRLMAALTGQ